MNRRHKGKVYLVGAGPGDFGLMTLKGLSHLKSSDLIVYDHLVNPDLLRLKSPSAKLVPAEKNEPGRKKSKQDSINRLLVREARKGLKVMRLKGGDPYLFGRGAEEGSFLKKSGIEFEVVPGVTSAAGCSAYAGVPLTDRHLSSSVAFVTGHTADNLDKKKKIRWDALLKAVDTIVVHMGVSQMGRIRQELLQHGAKPDKPVALIEWGTYPRQKSIHTTLKDLSQAAKKAAIHAPAVMIIGEVVKLGEALNWFEALPFFGKRIVITRARNQAHGFRTKLEELGATVLELPAISVQKPKSYQDLDREIENLYQYDWIVFTSTNGVDYFFDRLISRFKKDARSFSQVKIAAVGQSTRDHLKQYGIVCDFVPGKFSTSDLVQELRQRFGSLRAQRFLLPRTGIAPKDLELELKKTGASVTAVSAYDTSFPKSEILRNIGVLKKDGFDIITFTSSSTVSHLAQAIGLKRFRELLKRRKVVSIGPVTSQTLKAHGIRIHAEAAVSTLDGMIDSLKEI